MSVMYIEKIYARLVHTKLYLYLFIARTHTYVFIHMGSCQNYGPFLGTLNIRFRTILRTQKGTLILTTTHMFVCDGWMGGWVGGWMDGWVGGWMDACVRACERACVRACVHACMDGWMDGWMHGCMDAWMNGCMHAWMDAWMDGWMDAWMDVQHIHMQSPDCFLRRCDQGLHGKELESDTMPPGMWPSPVLGDRRAVRNPTSPRICQN